MTSLEMNTHKIWSGENLTDPMPYNSQNQLNYTVYPWLLAYSKVVHIETWERKQVDYSVWGFYRYYRLIRTTFSLLTNPNTARMKGIFQVEAMLGFRCVVRSRYQHILLWKSKLTKITSVWSCFFFNTTSHFQTLGLHIFKNSSD